MSDDLEAEMLVFLEHEQMEQTRAYVERGRHLQFISADELQDGWTAAFRAWVEMRKTDDHLRLQDHQAELILRGIQPSYDRIHPEFEAMRREIESGAIDGGAAERIEEFFRQRKKPAN